MTSGPPVPEGVLDILTAGEIEVIGLIPYSSNYTFLARVRAGDVELDAVYKPSRGERPLWDFPDGTLAAREVAAFVLSDAAGWGIVPPTVLRGDAPLGEGSLQLFIDHNPERHYFVVMEERHEELQVFAAFDVVVNNADRKSGHVLEGLDGRLWGIDHGVSFHTDPKLRTVIWEYAGEALSEPVVARLESVLAALGDALLIERLRPLLMEDEIAAIGRRTEALLEAGRFPSPASDRSLPWPLI